MDEIVDKFYKKVIKAEKELHKQWLALPKLQLIKEMCNLAYKQNFIDALIYYCENADPDDGMALTIRTIKFLLEYKGNIIDFIANTAQSIRHFESYNFNDWENDLPALIEFCVDYVEVKEERNEQRD